MLAFGTQYGYGKKTKSVRRFHDRFCMNKYQKLVIKYKKTVRFARQCRALNRKLKSALNTFGLVELRSVVPDVQPINKANFSEIVCSIRRALDDNPYEKVTNRQGNYAFSEIYFYYIVLKSACSFLRNQIIL